MSSDDESSGNESSDNESGSSYTGSSDTGSSENESSDSESEDNESVSTRATIVEELKTNTRLTTLGVCNLDDAGLQEVAEALKANTTLTKIGLQNNQIGDAGARAIAETLKVNTTLTQVYLHANQIGDVGARAFAETLKVNTTLISLNLPRNCISKAGVQAIDEARKVNSTQMVLASSAQMHPLVLCLHPRLATAEDVQTVLCLLTCGTELDEQPSLVLPALPVELAERITDEATHWQGVLRTKRLRFDADTPAHVLKATVPRSINANPIRVKAIQVLRDRKSCHNSDSTGSTGAFDVIVRDEHGAVRHECTVKPTFVESTLEFMSISPADHPIIRQMREGWEVQVRRSAFALDLHFESLYVGYTTI
ncbi:hypothetical protein CAOG_004436 [Capsaspora owczarzaki ATCC 30864]|uniref:NOD3 protein n=1 Tax=Capsaspora owczarzaki (strain ATCC 30864) TaxID=595528 RepID=A0A0D2UF12_CAPO3|nr:hypothetical protein CAOG_004436 [Capsaspora owczarzaki ATCC 30864]